MENNFDSLKEEVECLLCPVHNKSPKVIITDDYIIQGRFCCEEFLNKHEHLIGELQEMYEQKRFKERLRHYPRIVKISNHN